MLVKNILILCMVLLSLTFVNAFSSNYFTPNTLNLCYQESSNVSTSCGALSNGLYNISANWVSSGNNLINGIYGDYDYSNTGSYVYINYSTPSNANNLSLWQVAEVNYGDSSDLHYYNLSLGSCFNSSIIQLRVYQKAGFFTGDTNWSCYNGAWITLRNISGGYGGIYFPSEEAMFWNISQLTSENLSFTSNSNITRYLQVPQYTILTNAFMNLSGYAFIYKQFIKNGTSAGGEFYINDFFRVDYAGEKPYTLRYKGDYWSFNITNLSNGFAYNPLSSFNITLYGNATSTSGVTGELNYEISNDSINWYVCGSVDINSFYPYNEVTINNCQPNLTGNQLYIQFNKTSYSTPYLYGYSFKLEYNYPSYVTNLSTWVNNLNIFNQSGLFYSSGSTWDRYEYNNLGDTGNSASSTYSLAQTFTVGIVGANHTFNLSAVSLSLNRSGAVNFSVEIQYINATGYPNGSIIVQNDSYDFNNVGTLVYTPYNISLPSANLTAGTTYAIVLRYKSGAGTMNVKTKNSNVYNGGQKYYVNPPSSDTWVGETRDLDFEVFGTNSSITGTSNYTNNFANDINDYLSICTYSSGYCYVPITFHSDSAGILEYSNMIFNNSGILVNQLTYNNQTFETSREDFILNVTYDYLSFPVSTANFIYNGTSYLAIGTSGYFNVSADIPLVDADNTIRSFYWSIGLTNSSGTYYFNTSGYNQTINRINMSDCGGDTTVLALNFSAYDQTTFTKLTSWNFKATFDYFLGTGIYSRNVTFNNSGIVDKTICIRNHTDYKVSGAIQYSALNYDTADYNLNEQVINNITTNISFYLLNVSLTTTFIMQVLSQAQLPLSNYYIYVYRYDGSSFSPYLVQLAKTDEDGKTIGYFETYSVDYKFIVTDQDGNVVYTSEKRKIIPESTPYTLTFIVGTPIPSPFSYYQNLSGFSYSPVLTYNKVSGIVSVGYSDSNTGFQYAYLTVGYLNNSYNNDSLACNTTSTNPSGYLTCSLNASLSGSYYAEFHVIRNGVSEFIDRIVFNVKSIPEGIKMLSLLGAFFILLIFGTAFMYNVIAGVISIDIGFIVVEMLGLTDLGWLAVSGIIGVSVLIIIVLGRD